MNAKKLTLLIGGLVVLLLAAGIAGAVADRAPASPPLAAAPVSSGISYQGRLTSPNGSPLNGNHTMRFILYNQSTAGTAVWDSGNVSVAVTSGLFTVKLGVNPFDFDGQALWLSLIVNGETLSPRQEILPAPYALGLRAGADIVGPSLASSDAALAGYAPATGTALYADASGGIGVYGDSEGSYGVRGSSDDSWGGYFSSANGHGIRVTTTGADHYDHGAYITAQGGYGVYAQSANNQAVRGEAGVVSGIPQPLGAIGVVGLGSTRGMYAGSPDGIALYSRSGSNYAGYFYSDGYRGILASSATNYWAGYFNNRGGSLQPGVFVGGTLTVSGAKSGFVVDIARNEGPERLEVGDVVAVVGVDEPVLGEIPLLRVVRATAANAGAVVGVVDQRYTLVEVEGERVVQPDGAAPRLAAGNALETGELLSIVTLGAFKAIKVDAGYGPIRPGDLLTPSPVPGYAMRADGPAPGTVVGKALEALDAGQGIIAVYVTVQ